MIIFMSIFAVIIIGLIVVAFIGSKRDKRDKQIALDEIRAIENKAKNNHLKIYSILNEVLVYVDDQKEKFSFNSDLISLSEVNNKSNEVIKLIINSSELKEIYKSDDRKLEFKPVIEQLKNVKPTNWRKEAYFAVSLIEAKSKFSSNHDESMKKIKKYLWN